MTQGVDSEHYKSYVKHPAPSGLSVLAYRPAPTLYGCCAELAHEPRSWLVYQAYLILPQ